MIDVAAKKVAVIGGGSFGTAIVYLFVSGPAYPFKLGNSEASC